MFADDNSIFATSSDIQTIENTINSDLTVKMGMRLTKLKSCFFSNRPFINYPYITFDNASPETVDSHKHFGVYFSSNAKWDTQIDFIINKCTKMIGIFRKLKIKISRRCLNQMFLSFVKPILEYADVVLDSCSNDNAKSNRKKFN